MHTGNIKRCSKCGEVKSDSAFYDVKGRLTSWCKVCLTTATKAWNKANPEKVRATQKAYAKRKWIASLAGNRLRAEREHYDEARSAEE